MFYTMGNHMGKFLLLVTQMVVTYWCVLQPPSNSSTTAVLLLHHSLVMLYGSMVNVSPFLYAAPPGMRCTSSGRHWRPAAAPRRTCASSCCCGRSASRCRPCSCVLATRRLRPTGTTCTCRPKLCGCASFRTAQVQRVHEYVQPVSIVRTCLKADQLKTSPRAVWGLIATRRCTAWCRGGRGRHSFVFSRSTGQLSWLGFQTFCSVPFLYELRQILDWSCTPTTLNLFDWLKLEVRTAFIMCTDADVQRQAHCCVQCHNVHRSGQSETDISACAVTVLCTRAQE